MKIAGLGRTNFPVPIAAGTLVRCKVPIVVVSTAFICFPVKIGRMLEIK
jgi:hypothetical protein